MWETEARWLDVWIGPVTSVFCFLSCPRAVPLVISAPQLVERTLQGRTRENLESIFSGRRCRWATGLGMRDFRWRLFWTSSAMQAQGCSPGMLWHVCMQGLCRTVVESWLLLLCSVTGSCTALQWKQKMQLLAKYPVCCRVWPCRVKLAACLSLGFRADIPTLNFIISSEGSGCECY